MGYKKNLIKSLVKNIEKAAKKHILVDLFPATNKIIFEGIVKGMPRFKYEKRYNGSTYYVEEIRKGKQTLNIVTIYKIKTPSDAKSE